MGCVNTIAYDKFPKQGKHLGKRVDVCFHYDTSKIVKGNIVRDDCEEPSRTIIKLDDGRYVLGIECHYSIVESDMKSLIHKSLMGNLVQEKANFSQHKLTSKEINQPVSFQEAVDSGKNVRFEFRNDDLKVIETEFKPLDKLFSIMNTNLDTEEISLIIREGKWFIE